VDDNKINDQRLDHHQWQPDMPSPDVAWSNMLGRLDKEMPINNKLGKASNKKILHNKKLYLIILLIMLLNVKHEKERLNTQQVKIQAITDSSANTSVSRQKPVTGLSDTLLIVKQEKAIAGNNLEYTRVQQPRSASDNNHVLKAALTPAKSESDTITEKRISVLQDTIATSAGNETTILNDKKVDIQKPKSLAVQPTDSLQNSNDDNEEKKLSVRAGLQWTAPVPFAGTKNYFAGPSATAQPWRLLLPGVWIHFKADKDMLIAEVNPFAAASFNPASFYINSETSEQMTRETNKAITKVFGVAGAISYQHNIINNWWAGGGIQANFWNKGVAVLTIKEHNNATSSTNTSTENYVISKDDWQYFQRCSCILMCS
jgi:hypothetical protein